MKASYQATSVVAPIVIHQRNNNAIVVAEGVGPHSRDRRWMIYRSSLRLASSVLHFPIRLRYRWGNSAKPCGGSDCVIVS